MGKTNFAIVGGYVSYFFVSSPLRWFIAFKLEYGIEGLWIGMIFGFVCLCLFNQYIISFHYDWEILAKEAFVIFLFLITYRRGNILRY